MTGDQILVSVLILMLIGSCAGYAWAHTQTPDWQLRRHRRQQEKIKAAKEGE